MPYMIYQQYKTAIKAAYADAANLDELYQSASSCRKFLESLQIDVQLRNPLVEQLVWIEDAFVELAKKDKSD